MLLGYWSLWVLVLALGLLVMPGAKKRWPPGVQVAPYHLAFAVIAKGYTGIVHPWLSVDILGANETKFPHLNRPGFQTQATVGLCLSQWDAGVNAWRLPLLGAALPARRTAWG